MLKVESVTQETLSMCSVSSVTFTGIVLCECIHFHKDIEVYECSQVFFYTSQKKILYILKILFI